jgi:hypothetical protein
MPIQEESVTIVPPRWGPHFWKCIDSIAVVFDPTSEQSKEYTLYFFHSLQGVLPCYECRDHYCLYYQEHPLLDSLGSKRQLLEWILRLKNTIQTRLGHPTYTMDEYVHHMEELYDVTLNRTEHTD